MAYRGACFCGAVQLAVTGIPLEMGYCHCRSCRSWTGSPLTAYSIWKAEAVQITAGADHLATFQKTPISQRQYCRTCGGHVMVSLPRSNLIDVLVATIPTLDFRPSTHIHYGETVLRMRDGLPKWRDMPSELGGSGETVPE